MESTKTCKDCKATLPRSDFPSVQHRGATEYLARCTACHRIYQAERLKHWRDGRRLSPDTVDDLASCVAVLRHYQHHYDEEIGVLMGNAGQMIEFAIFLLEEKRHEKKQQKKHWSSVS